MTKEEIKNNYPETWRQFRDWFRSEGWGADSADELSQRGVDVWFPDFMSCYEISDIDKYENSIETTW